MKISRNVYSLALLLLATALLSNCKSDLKTEEVPVEVPKDKYLVSYNVVRSMTASDVNTLYGPVQFLYPDVSDILPYIKSGARVYSITYNTTLGTKKLVASGLVTIPDGGGTYPMLSFQNGTNTLYANAPSLSAYNSTIQLLNGFATTGFVVLMPDYLGFGSSTEVFHPYLVMDATVNPILDMFRAVKEMTAKTDLAFKLSPDLYIMGYSQGGLSTLQLQKSIETNYSSEFNLKAVGCGAGPYNLTQITDAVVTATTYLQPYYIAYIMKGFKSVGSFTNTYADIFNEPYASRIDGLFNGLNSGSAINAQLSTNMSQLFTSEFRTNWKTNTKFQGIKDALAASGVPAWKIKTPLILAHGQADTDVTPLMSSTLYNDLMSLDKTLPVTYIPMPGLDHGGASAPALINFVKRFLAIKGK